MNLKSKSNSVLVSELRSFVSEERQATLRVLHYLREVETRRLHLEAGYPSLFEYCVRELGYSEGAAHRRVSAMRLMRDIPQVEKKIEAGRLSLTAAAKAQSHFKESAKAKKPLATFEKVALLRELEGLSTRDCERKLAERFPEMSRPTDRTRPMPGGETRIEFTADAALMEKLERLKALLAHRNFKGEYAKLFHQLADLALKQLDPGERQTRAMKAKRVDSNPENSRYIAIDLRKTVWVRDRGKCTYRAANGRVCGSTHGVQFDHRILFSRGGRSSAENLRLLCGAHNRYRAEKMGLRRYASTPAVSAPDGDRAAETPFSSSRAYRDRGVVISPK